VRMDEILLLLMEKYSLKYSLHYCLSMWLELSRVSITEGEGTQGYATVYLYLIFLRILSNLACLSHMFRLCWW
jgi:hypothetical protein